MSGGGQPSRRDGKFRGTRTGKGKEREGGEREEDKQVRTDDASVRGNFSSKDSDGCEGSGSRYDTLIASRGAASLGA